jgi:hypothetical protein
VGTTVVDANLGSSTSPPDHVVAASQQGGSAALGNV